MHLCSPVVRTNPVTGWKSLMAADGQLDNGYIHGVTHRESDIFKAYCKANSLRGLSYVCANFEYPD